MKTRSPVYFRLMSDKVLAKVTERASELNISRWLLVENILEKAFNIKNDEMTVSDFIGVNRFTGKVGTPMRKKIKK